MKPIRKILVVATTKWGSKAEARYIAETREIMMAGGAFADVVISIEYRNIDKPDTYEDAEGVTRITHDWFEANISNAAKAGGYNSSRLRFSKAEGHSWGLDSGIRGVNYSDNPNDFHGEGWICSDSKTMVRFKDGSKRLLAPKATAHEEAHELKHAGLTDLNIHDFDYQNSINNVEEFYRRLVLRTPGQTNTLISMLSFLIQLKNELLNRANYPISRDNIFKPSQHWLVPNPLYESGYHNGTDFPVFKGTALLAPQRGNVYLSGHTEQLGYFAFYECVVDGKKTFHLFPHLTKKPRTGDYQKGEIIGHIGNTGLTTGPHLHWTILLVKPVSVSHYVSLVNTKENIINNTVDPYRWCIYAVDRITL